LNWRQIQTRETKLCCVKRSTYYDFRATLWLQRLSSVCQPQAVAAARGHGSSTNSKHLSVYLPHRW